MIGTDGRFRLVNAALCKLLGRTEAELLQRTLAKTIHPEEWSARKRLFERMLTGEIRTHQTQGRVVTGQGEARWMLVNATALTDGDGWPTEFFVQFQDITEQARGQQLLGARHDVTRVLAQATGVEQAAPLLLEALGANLGLGGRHAVAGRRGVRRARGDRELAPPRVRRRPPGGRRAHARGPAGARDALRPAGVDRGADGGRRLAARVGDRRGRALGRRLPADRGRGRLPRRDGVLLPRARGARRAAARAARHHRHADRPLHRARPRDPRAGRRPRRGARGDRR